MKGPIDKPIDRFKYWTPKDIYVLWAAMVAMVQDIHSPQDNLTEQQWERAERLLQELDAYVNEVFPEDVLPRD